MGDDLGGEAVAGEGVEGGLEVGVEVGGGGRDGVVAEADDPGVALAEEELDQAVPALGAAGAVVAADPQWRLASHVSGPSLVAVGVRLRREHRIGGV
ncbi:MAG TPA: hypothetical protein VL330_09260 [Actinomycetes bacterium]|nr:hypothetical protein [Actinomycetes bacterium]